MHDDTMITIYGFSPSGNCHKVRLLLEQIGREYRWVEIDSSKGETRTPEFLAKNPNGRVPIIELDDGRVLAESNAILCWLAEDLRLQNEILPDDRHKAGAGVEFFEQYSHEPYVASRASSAVGQRSIPTPRRAAAVRERGHNACGDGAHLATSPWFTGSEYGIADMHCSPTPM